MCGSLKQPGVWWGQRWRAAGHDTDAESILQKEESEPERGRGTAPSVGEAVDRALILPDWLGNELKSIFEGAGSQKNLFFNKQRWTASSELSGSSEAGGPALTMLSTSSEWNPKVRSVLQGKSRQSMGTC